MNGMLSEAQMRDRHGTRFFGVVDEVSLRIVLGLFANDFDRVLVCPHCSVRAQAPEDALHEIPLFESELRIIIQAGMCHIVVNADRKVVFRLRTTHLVKDALHHCRCKFLRGEAIASSNHHWLGTSCSPSLTQSCHNVQIEWFAHTPWLLRPI